MTQALAKVDEQSVLTQYTREQIDLIKSQIAPKATDSELKLFLYVANRRGLDPLARQIYAIHRWDKQAQVDKMTLQTSIDGFRSIAERSGTYAPGEEKWEENEKGVPISATVSVQKFVHGTWIKFSATAHYSEYFSPIGGMWSKMPHVMLAKCAEAKALRKGWPEALDGLYVDEEMQQADNSRLDAIPQETAADRPGAVVREIKPTEKVEVVTTAKLTANDSIPAKLLSSLRPLGHLGGIRFCDMNRDELEAVAEHAPRVRGSWAQMPNVDQRSLAALYEMEVIAGTLLDAPVQQ